ncbi:hypothetical protein [Tolypothrix sp. VBCCA 56010]|uniref:hypothetical protein n=1 Tax=Tolypothrix sp. VBCCA 56010 TaxID=3137731 RepID=UPI003D7DE140
MGHGAWGMVYVGIEIRLASFYSHCPLPIAHCPLPIAQCPMPIAQCPLPNSQSKI